MYLEHRRRNDEGGGVFTPFTPARPATFDEVDAGIPFLEDKITGNIPEVFAQQPAPRIFKSHQPFSCDEPPCRGWVAGAMAKWQCGCPNCASQFQRVVYIVRDGRAAMHSYWRFQQELHLRGTGSGSTFERFLRWSQRRRYPGVSWSDHVRSWMSARPGVDILWVRYEDMQADPHAVLARVAAFLGGEFARVAGTEDDAISWAVSAASRESMRRTERDTGSGFFAKRYGKRDQKFHMVHAAAGSGSDHGVGWRERFQEIAAGESNEAYFRRKQGYMLDCLRYPAVGAISGS